MPYTHKEDQKKTSDKWYAEHKQVVIDKKNTRRRLAKAYVKELKTDRSCLDCLRPYEWFQFDYHHRVGTVKRCAVGGTAALGYSIESIRKEIDKCDLLCANCHRMRHQEDYNSGTKT